MEINEILIRWYENAGRDLPWRNTENPYEIWVSEIILQQTRVAQGMDYYRRFLEHFPGVSSLAASKVEEVLRVWQGLGYYSRARNMHRTASDIVANHGGIFPRTYKTLLELKGIGPYTAAAIASIAFGEAIPAIDGNVKRVISRIYGITADIGSVRGNREIATAAGQIMDNEDPGKFNQAMMDFGSLVCRPKNPDCLSCPVQNHCYAFKNKMTDRLPVKTKAKDPIRRYFYFFILKHKGKLYIEQRTGRDIWNLLYQFPLMEADAGLSDREIIGRMKERWPGDLHIRKISDTISHQLSHQLIISRFIHVSAPGEMKDKGLLEIPENELGNYAVPRLIEKYVEDAGWL